MQNGGLDSIPLLSYPRQSDRLLKGTETAFVAAGAIGMVVLLIWLNCTYLDKITRGQGRIIPKSQNQTVQHLEGGILAEILVREGEPVEKGSVLMRVQNSFSQSELSQSRLDIAADNMKLLRLTAESLGQPMDLPVNLSGSEQSFAQHEMALYSSRRRTLDAQIAIISEQIKQKTIELSELRARLTNTQQERTLVIRRLDSLRRLAEMGAVSSNDLLDNERGLQQLDSRLSDTSHEIPRIESALEELQRRYAEASLHFQSDAYRERSDVELHLAKLQESALALQDRSERSDVIAPINGVVNKLFVSTTGGVVKSGEPLAIIVPVETSIAVEARIAPSDRAEVWPGLPAVIKVSAYEFSLYGGLKANVVEVSPDALQDERGQPYFRVRLEASGDGFGPDRPVVPGMIANVDIVSGRRSIMSSLLKPLRYLQENALRQ